MSELSHVDAAGAARMVDVTGKAAAARVAVASGTVRTTAEVVGLLASNGLKKGDALATARIAGIMGAKRTPDLIPLCHPIALSGVTVDFALGDAEVDITATARTTDVTGVEMEALTAVAVAGLTLHDMIKAVDPAAVLDAVRLERKDGGKTGTWTRPEDSMTRTARVVTASNRAAAGVYSDKTGPLIAGWLRDRGYDVRPAEVVPDGEPVRDALRAAVAAGVDVVITTGGTGISPTDRTPEMTGAVLDYEIPGLADAVRAAGLPKVPTAVLSRGRAGVAGATLIVNLPGSTGGVKDGLGVLDGVLEHAIDQVHGGDHAAGGAGTHAAGARVLRARRSARSRPLSVEEHATLVEEAAAGAVVTFAGVVRDHDKGRGVVNLDYEGHPSAKAVIEEVAAAVAGRHPGLRAIAVSHRIGALAIGDVALACAVAAEHRQEAFAACADLVDDVKAPAADLEAPELHRRHRRVGQLPLSAERRGSTAGGFTRWSPSIASWRATSRSSSLGGDLLTHEDQVRVADELLVLGEESLPAALDLVLASRSWTASRRP